MPKNNTTEKTPLLKANGHTNYNGIDNSHTSINNSDSSSTESIIDMESDDGTTTEIANDSLNNLLLDSDSNNTVISLEIDWIDSVARYGGKTQKRKYINGNWEYDTEIRDSSNNLKSTINESFKDINNQLYWYKEIIEENNKVTLEILSVNNNKLISFYKIFKNKIDYINFLPITLENINEFQQIKNNLSFEYNFLEGITIKKINNINKFIENTKLFNEQIRTFKENPNNRDLNVLLKLYKYLTVMQKFFDSSKVPVDISISAKFKRMLVVTTGLLQIYIGLTGKNLQRVVSNYPIDGKEHTTQDYLDAVFLNWQNYLMVFIDTALGTLLTSTASSWSREVIFNKQSKTNPFEIKQFNIDGFQKYKDIFEALLYEENHQELMKHFSKMTAVNDLMQKFNEIENSIEFEYHLNFKTETDTIKQLIAKNVNDDIEIKQVIVSVNKTIKTFEKPMEKPLALVNNWGCNLLVNLTLETLTWGTSHVILTGSSENMSKENFNLQDWINKDIFTTGALIANVSRYFVMRPINNIFKSGLSKLGIPTNICPEKFKKWINKQSRGKKLMMAIPLFLTVTFTVNAVKTEAALTTEHGIKKATELFYEKFFRLTTLGFSMGVTMIDMIAFAISDFYKDVFNQSISIKTLTNIFAKCCGFNKEETTLLEDNLTKLENDGKLPIFDEQFKKYQEKKSIDSGFDENSVNSIDLQNQPSTSTEIHHSI